MSVTRRLARLRVPLGFAFAIVVAWLATPSWTSLAWGLPIAGIGEALRIWAAGHLEKSREVTRSGPYRWLRHPLYAGSSLMAAGLAIAAGSIAVALIVAVYMATTITAAIVSENAFLRQTFGADYAAWQAGAMPAVERRFSLERAVRNREYRALAGLLLGAALLSIKLLPIF
ncbi:MAG TPA: isoprenylcysteine carboxylmethyltransferase family protein [Vicinamibacterales bacterium]|nr:isoprenylcysteine carboxylmethyltransferase family protein [Vicinamibacterales bacterium]